MDNGSIVVKPLDEDEFTLKDLVKGITHENRHDEVDWGPPVGKEVW